MSIDEELSQIKNLLSRFPQGSAIEEIARGMPGVLNRRTLQRRLSRLVDIGEITITRNGRNTHYSLKQTELLHLSAASKEILELVSKPTQLRQAVGYNREFLESYIPNHTQYLSPSEIEQLFQLGKTYMQGRPVGTYVKEVLKRLLLDLSWNSSRLEGNTYSLLDTERLIDFNEIADNKSNEEAQMILNHKDAIEFLVNSPEHIGFNRMTILNLHALLADNLLSDPDSPGRLRSIIVGIGKSVYTPLSIPSLISEVFNQILEKASSITNPFEQAFFIMVHIPYLQPFDDVNKRVSRLAANIPFIRHNLSPLSFVDVPEHLYIAGTLAVYELNRIELLKDVFLYAYERSAYRYANIRQVIGTPDIFRMQYRNAIRTIVTKVIKDMLTPKAASAAISDFSHTLPEADRAKFIEVVDSELLGLHEGNIARYRIDPPEFAKFHALWN